MPENNITILRLGLVNYDEVLTLQRSLQAELIAGVGKNTLILCQHPSVITLGRRAKTCHILASKDELLANRIEIFNVERGGDVTLHCPEQLVCYPILNISKQHNVHWYVYNLEEIVIRVLAEFGIKALRISGKTGVWINKTIKISSLGVRISKWCTMHGFALNVNRCPDFNLIVPCGLTDVKMTSIEEELNISQKINMSEIEELVIKHFLELFYDL